MKLFDLYLLTILFPIVRSSLMPTKKICRDCKYFIGDNFECRKFGDTNLVTGKVTYNSARSAREDVTKCGEDASQFEENHFKIVTIPYYFIKKYSLVMLPSGLLILYFYGMILNLSHK